MVLTVVMLTIMVKAIPMMLVTVILMQILPESGTAVALVAAVAVLDADSVLQELLAVSHIRVAPATTAAVTARSQIWTASSTALFLIHGFYPLSDFL